MIQVFLGIELVWLLILTVAIVGVIRYVGVLQVTGTGTTGPQGNALLDTDGPSLPSPLPDRAVAALRTHGVQTTDLVATFFAASCGTCLERAEQVATALIDPPRNVFLVSGDVEAAKDLIQILAPTGVPVVTDPDAQNIVKSLDIMSTPFTFRVAESQVVAKSFVRGIGDYARMFNADPPVAGSGTSSDDSQPVLKRAR